MNSVGLCDLDKTNFPNLALMKLAQWHKARGDRIEFFNPMMGEYNIIYSSKVFTWGMNDAYLPNEVVRGGIGYDTNVKLPDHIEHTCPDYELYSTNYSLGFTTRGCPNHCKWCVVPLAEGEIRAHAHIDEFTRHRDLILLDNNILAHPHGIGQLELISSRNLRLDCNQGLDARLIDYATARLLANIRWSKYIRLACDTSAMIPTIDRAVSSLRTCGYRGGIFCYVLVTEDINDALERVEHLRGLKIDPFAQPFRDRTGKVANIQQRRFARWVNHKAIFKSTSWLEYGRTPHRAQPDAELFTDLSAPKENHDGE